MNLKQQVDKSDAYYIERFRKMVGKCSFQFFGIEYASMVINDMHPDIKEKEPKKSILTKDEASKIKVRKTYHCLSCWKYSIRCFPQHILRYNPLIKV